MKILLVDDHLLFRAGLRLLLAALDPATQVVEAGTVAQALEESARHPDLQACLLDLALEHRQDGLQALRLLKGQMPALPVVVVSAADDAATVRACLDAGAMSFIPKSLGPDVLTQALQHVMHGTVYLPEHVLGSVNALPPAPLLTVRQQQVLQALARGLPTKLIARELQLSEHTVKEHLALVYEALGARSRTEAVIKATRLRLIEPGGPA